MREFFSLSSSVYLLIAFSETFGGLFPILLENDQVFLLFSGKTFFFFNGHFEGIFRKRMRAIKDG